MIIERAGHGHVGLEIFEAGLLQRAIRCHVERIRFAEKPLQLEPLEIDLDAAPHAFGADPLTPALGINDVQVHVGLLAIADLVGGRKANGLVARQPDDGNPGSLLDRPCEILPEAFAPVFRGLLRYA